MRRAAVLLSRCLAGSPAAPAAVLKNRPSPPFWATAGVPAGGPLILAALLGAAPALGQEAPANDTSGSALMESWRRARGKFHDALLVGISGATGPDGQPVCAPDAPFQHGWRYSFYSPSADKFLMMASCRGAIAGPLVQMREGDAAKFPIQGKFIDSDFALRTLAGMGVPLEPREHEAAGGRRPFALKLFRLEDDRFKTHPVVWKIGIGKKFWLVDAVHNERFEPQRYGVASLDEVEISTASSRAVAALAKRPKRTNAYTARKDYERVVRYASEKYPGSSLMAVDGFVDAWGGSPCTGPGDGWAFYWYFPVSRNIEVIFACNGYIGPGPSSFIPVDRNQHKAIVGDFIDSDALVDSLLIHHPDSMNEGMGRAYKRNGTLRLRNYKASPFVGTDKWNITMLWEARIGRTDYFFDARNGKFLKAIER